MGPAYSVSKRRMNKSINQSVFLVMRSITSIFIISLVWCSFDFDDNLSLERAIASFLTWILISVIVSVRKAIIAISLDDLVVLILKKEFIKLSKNRLRERRHFMSNADLTIKLFEKFSHCNLFSKLWNMLSKLSNQIISCNRQLIMRRCKISSFDCSKKILNKHSWIFVLFCVISFEKDFSNRLIVFLKSDLFVAHFSDQERENSDASEIVRVCSISADVDDLIWCKMTSTNLLFVEDDIKKTYWWSLSINSINSKIKNMRFLLTVRLLNWLF